MNKFLHITGILLLCVASSPATAASTWRCESKLVSLDDSQYLVSSKCGQPIDKSFLGYKQVINEYRHVHEVPVEEWAYGPNNGMYHYLRFEGNVLVKISSSR